MTWPEALVYIVLIVVGVPGFVAAMWLFTRQPGPLTLRDRIGESKIPMWTSTKTGPKEPS